MPPTEPAPTPSAGVTPPRLFTFVAGATGPWCVDHVRCLAGEPLPAAERVTIDVGAPLLRPDTTWALRGITSHERYVRGAEKAALVARQEGLGRPASTCAALIPIRKTATWWGLAQDERREIVEAQSRHIEVGLRYLPAIARRLHHCRDLGPDEPFDFITWFEYEPAAAGAFDELVGLLRASPEWTYVDRDVDVRLSRV